ncbi:MAG: bifunctional nicotinamide-nucleotide adenylyltransferase/Nudix hydroxylase [Pseudomonadota bacterium]
MRSPPQSAPRHDIAVYVGRFQPFHNGHLALLQRALKEAPLCVVVLGSAHQARTPKNPFTWQERAEMIRQALPEADHARLHFVPVRDYYNETRWVQAVLDGVSRVAAEVRLHSPQVVMVGHFKDATSEYLRRFPGWQLISLDRMPTADATQLRAALFATADQPLRITLSALVDQAPASTLGFLRSWACLPFFQELAQEWQRLQDDKARWAGSPYPPVFVTVDAVVRCAGQVLLIQRGHFPGKGLFAVPGGFIEQRETVYQSALRELKEETHLNLLDHSMQLALREVAVFDHPDRSLRGRVITHAHFFDLGERELPEVQADDDAQAACWMPIDELLGMEDRFHDDHFHMLDHFFGLTA